MKAAFLKSSAITFILLLLSLLSCGKEKTAPKSQASSTVSQQGGTLVFGRGGDSVGLDPAHEDDGESFKVCDSLYEMLVQYKEESTEVEPGLAESWGTSVDGLEWTFQLRKGVKFHDGTLCDAEAVVFSLDRQRDPKYPYHNIGGAYLYWESMSMDDVIKGVTAVGQYTVKISLKRPYAPFLSAMAILPFAIVSPTAVKKWGADFGSHPVGTGPFKFVSWNRDDKIILEANPDYWNGKPKLDRIIFRSIPDNSVRLLELQNGAIDGLDDPNPDDLGRIKADPKLQLIEQPGLNVAYIAMNFDKKPFDLREVRLAVNHAINKKAIVDQLYQGMGAVAKNPIPPTIWGYDDTIQDYKYDPSLAKQLLAKAGFSKGFMTRLWAMPVPRPYAPTPLKIAEAIKADLEKVGISAKIVQYDWGTYLDKVRNGEHDMAMLGWSADYGDPDNFLYILLDKESAKKPANNIAFYRSEELHAILVEAQKLSDQPKRAALYKKALAIIHDDVPWVPLAHAKQVVALSKKVKNFKLHPTSKKDFRSVWMESR